MLLGVVATDANSAWAVGAGGVILHTTDGGATWARWGSGLPFVNVTDIWVAPDSSKVRLATFGRGFWELQGSVVVTAPAITGQPSSVTVTAPATATVRAKTR
jgi:hypothetical protein